MKALAMSIAWEQVRSWQTFLTARQAAELVGMRRGTWRQIAERVAKMWMELPREAWAEAA